MSEIKPVSIKTTVERIKDATGAIVDPRSDFYSDHFKAEIAEYRAALEALQKENELHKAHIKRLTGSHDRLKEDAVCDAKTIAAQAKRIAELELSAIRYEKLRRLNAYQFQNIFKQNLTSCARFDDLVDSLSAQKGTE
jgi:predicted phage gp36 major capsid-like protein